MKNNYKLSLILTFLVFFIGAHAQTTINCFSNNQIKPYSFKIDCETSKKIIEASRKRILESNDINLLLADVSSKDYNSRCNAVKKLSYFTQDDARINLEYLMLNDSSVDIRTECVQALGVIGSPKSIPLLIKALNDKSGLVRIYAALTLAQLGEKEVSLKYISKLYHEIDVPYYSCHQAFLHIGTKGVRQYLIVDMTNKDPFVAVDAAIILAELGCHSEAYSCLKNFRNHFDKYVRMAALRGLAYIGDSDSLALISLSCNDPDKLVAERAKIILEMYNKK